MLGVALAAVIFALPPVVIHSHPNVDRNEALNNIRQVGMSLFEFDSEYGRFPDASTIAQVKEQTHTELDLGDGSSNQIFRQLLALVLKSEKPFWGKTQ